MATENDRRDEPAGWFRTQAVVNHDLGSPLYGALAEELADRIADGHLDDIVELTAGARFGDAVPLRLLGAAHAVALAGDAPELACHYPSCGGTVDRPIGEVADAVVTTWRSHPDVLDDYLRLPVQTNETGRSAALVLGLDALARTVPPGTPIALVELGPSAGLNLRMDAFAHVAGATTLGGRPDSPVTVESRWAPRVPSFVDWNVETRIGIDPHPQDPTDPTVARRLRSYVFADQNARLARLDGALTLAAELPVDLIASDDTAETIREVLANLAGHTPTLVYHSIVWQYIDRSARAPITSAIAAAGRRATADAPLMRLMFEPDQWDRSRVEVDLHAWPGSSGRVIARADYHGRWVDLAGRP